MQNPFKPAQAVSKKLKILLYGPSGSGKTLAALTFPKCALIDAEGGADLYTGRVAPFDILRAKTVTELENAVKFIQADNGKTYETLIVDPITVFYDVARDATGRAAKNGEMGFKEWSKLNNRMKAVYNALTNLPVHVVIVARQAVEYDGSGLDLRKVGVKPDADKALPYMADFIIRLNPDHTGVVEKSRGTTLLKGDQTTVTWSVFEPLASSFAEGETIAHVSEDEAAEAEADSMQDRETATAFLLHWRNQSLTDQNVLTALGVTRLSEWTKGRKAADEAVRAYLDAQLSGGMPPSPAPNGNGKATPPPADPPMISIPANKVQEGDVVGHVDGHKTITFAIPIDATKTRVRYTQNGEAKEGEMSAVYNVPIISGPSFDAAQAVKAAPAASSQGRNPAPSKEDY